MMKESNPYSKRTVGNAPVRRDNGGRAGLAFACGKCGTSFWNKTLDPRELGLYSVSLDFQILNRGKREGKKESTK